MPVTLITSLLIYSVSKPSFMKDSTVYMGLTSGSLRKRKHKSTVSMRSTFGRCLSQAVSNRSIADIISSFPLFHSIYVA
jgi:hypothetical protein